MLGGTRTTITSSQVWNVNLDLMSYTFNLTNSAGAGYFGFISSLQNTYYVAFFKDTGMVKFTTSLTITDTAYIKKVINAATTGTQFPFTWLAVYNDSSLRTIPMSSLLQSLESGIHNMIGQSLSTAKVIGYSWTFLVVEYYSCIGLIDTSNVAGLSLTTDIRSQSIAICSDNTKYGVTASKDVTITTGQAWTLNIDYFNNKVSFTQNGTGGGSYSASFSTVDSTYYTAQLSGFGSVQFGSTVTHIVV
jgi:hypothetical protein